MHLGADSNTTKGDSLVVVGVTVDQSFSFDDEKSVITDALAGHPDKFDTTKKSKLEGAAVNLNETIKWLDASQEGSEEEYKENRWN
jgi:heat shock 70kDa protein 1/2/6/8